MYWFNLQIKMISTPLGSNNSFISIFLSVSFHQHPRFTRQQGKGETSSLIPFYHYDPLNSHLYISRVITAESPELHT